MKPSANATVCALLLITPIALTPGARADSQPWHWRFQPPAKSHWDLVIFERLKNTGTQDMVHFWVGFDAKGARKNQQQKMVRETSVDEASRRVRFDLEVLPVEVLPGEADNSVLRWTFRGMEVTRERDSDAASTFGDETLDANSRLQMQKQRLIGLQKRRNDENRAARRFSRKLAGASFSCAVNGAGRITRSGGWEIWQKRVSAAISQANDGSFLQMAFPALLTPTGMKNWVQGWTDGLSNAPLQSGQSWQFNAKIADLDTLTPVSALTRTLQTRGEKVAVVDETATFRVASRVASPTPKLEPNSVAYTFSCQGTRQARLQIDAWSGIPFRTSRRLEMKGNRGVVNDRGRSLQDEAFSLLVTSEIVARLHKTQLR